MQRLEIRSVEVRRGLRGIVVELRTNFGTRYGVEVELRHGHRRLVRRHVARVGTRGHRVILRVRGGVPAAGHYVVAARRADRLLAERTVVIHSARKLTRLVG